MNIYNQETTPDADEDEKKDEETADDAEVA